MANIDTTWGGHIGKGLLGAEYNGNWSASGNTKEISGKRPDSETTKEVNGARNWMHNTLPLPPPPPT